MSQKQNQSSDLVMGMFGFIVVVVGASAARESLDGPDGAAWLLWMIVVVGGGMVMGVATNNLAQKDRRVEPKKAEPAKKAEKAKKPAKKKVNA